MRIGVVSDTPFGSGVRFPNGFSGRHKLIVDQLAHAGHDILVIPGLLRVGPVNQEYELIEATRQTHLHVGMGSYRWPESRLRHRLKSVARVYWLKPGRTKWEDTAKQALHEWSPDVVLALAPWEHILASVAPKGAPVALFAEEDVRPVYVGQRAQPRAEWKEWLRITLRGAPAVVVTISATENAWAAGQYPRSTILTVPHAVDLDYWSPTAIDPNPHAPDILCAGDFSQERNHTGLQRILEALPTDAPRPTIGIASAKPPPDDLLTGHHADVRYLGPIDDLRPLYRGSTLTLVPAFTVTGVKTQILQAWAMRCPVVTTTAGAASVGGHHGTDLLAGDTPEQIAALLPAIATNPDLATTLTTNGHHHVTNDYSQTALTHALNHVLDTLTAQR